MTRDKAIGGLQHASGLTPAVTDAVILAGGRGERLRPLTQDRPKCMVEVNGMPILAYQLNWLRTHGVKRVVIACGYLHESIQSYFGASYLGLEISYAIENQPLGRGGALKAGFRKLGPTVNSVIAMNADNICDLPIGDLAEHHLSTGALITVVTTKLRSPYGIVDITEDGKISGFSEKPELPHFINCGIYLLKPEAIDRLPDKGDHEELTFPALAREGELAAYCSRALWRTVDTIKDLFELEADLRRGLNLGNCIAYTNLSPLAIP